MPFIIGGLQKTSLLDYPDKIACIVFTQGCNFRCGYCHNPELFIKKESDISMSSLFEFLKIRQGKLDGVVITGGEPTIQSELKNVITEIKSLGFLVKLDTNGTNPTILEKLIDDKLIDYVAMDIKAPLAKYEIITNSKVNSDNIKKSIEIILNNNIDYEFRTTVIKSQLRFEDFEKIGQLINGANKYFLQKFIPSKILDESLRHEKTYEKNEETQICKILEKYVKQVCWRC